MKKIAFLFGFIFFFSTSQVYAQTPTAKPTMNDTTLIDQINNLKDRIASRVAQLKLVEKRGIIGTVTEVSDTKMTVNDHSGAIRFVDVDEITKFSSPSAKGSFGISDISKGTSLSVLGLYNKQSKRIQARFVDVFTQVVFLRGTVEDVDKENFTVTVKNEKNEKYIVDIETSTKATMYIDDEVGKSGFSQILKGQKIYVSGLMSKTEKKRLSANRILSFLTDSTTPSPTTAPTVKPTTITTP